MIYIEIIFILDGKLLRMKIKLKYFFNLKLIDFRKRNKFLYDKRVMEVLR